MGINPSCPSFCLSTEAGFIIENDSNEFMYCEEGCEEWQPFDTTKGRMKQIYAVSIVVYWQGDYLLLWEGNVSDVGVANVFMW